MADTVISESPPSSPPISPSQPPQDQLCTLIPTSEPLADNNGSVEDGAILQATSTASMEDTVIPESLPSSPPISPSQPVEDQLSAVTLNPEPLADNNGGVEDSAVEFKLTTTMEDAATSQPAEDQHSELALTAKPPADSNGGVEGGAVIGEDGGGTEVAVVEGEAVEEGNVKEEIESEEREHEVEREERSSKDDAIYSNANGSNDRNSKKSRFPVRPEAELCTFYMKTASCKFGMNCKFNHPPDRKAAQVGNVKGKEEHVDTAAENLKEKKSDFVGREGQIDCKYVDRPGGCKFGKACKFNHSKKTSPTSELNFMGLPIRQGERECPYYMRNGSCKFGASCRFNHPDPTSIGAHDTLPNYSNGGSISSPTALKLTVKPWSRPVAPNESPYVPLRIPPAQSNPSQPEWTAYPAPVYAPGRSAPMAAGYATNSKSMEGNIYPHQQDQIVADEFPERPGQPECSYFLRTGDCKYRSACKFHHPKSTHVKSPPSSVSDLGLPLRPVMKAC